MNMLVSSIHIRWLMFRRVFREIPFPYYIFGGAGLVALFYGAVHADVPFTPYYAAVFAFIYVAFYRYFFGNKKRALFLRQLGSAGVIFAAQDALICAIPFLLVGMPFFLLSLLVGALHLLAGRLPVRCGARSGVSLSMPSPFLKPSYLWHSQSRPYLLLGWLLLNVTLFFAYRYSNFNLAIVAFCSISGGAVACVLLQQQESIFFVRQYCSVRRFVASGLREACANAALFMLVPAAFFLAAFFASWKVTALAVFAVCYLAVTLTWVRYLFWDVSPFIAILFVGLFLYVQAFLAYSVYGIPAALLFQYLLYRKFYSSAQRLLNNEKLNNENV
jgi:hypothetical protein